LETHESRGWCCKHNGSGIRYWKRGDTMKKHTTRDMSLWGGDTMYIFKGASCDSSFTCGGVPLMAIYSELGSPPPPPPCCRGMHVRLEALSRAEEAAVPSDEATALTDSLRDHEEVSIPSRPCSAGSLSCMSVRACCFGMHAPSPAQPMALEGESGDLSDGREE